jgi:ABC-2 type transport system ATP-binding protein
MAHRGDDDGPAVRLERISKSFGPIRAVDGLSMDVRKGTIRGLLGLNAAGKTTTIKLMTGKLKPDSGSATVLGQAMPEGHSKIAASVGVMPQGQALYGDLAFSVVIAVTMLGAARSMEKE